MNRISITIMLTLGLALTNVSISLAEEPQPTKSASPDCLSPAPEAAFLGRLKVIDGVLDTSIERLNANDLSGFMDTAQNLVLAFDGLSSDVLEAFRTSGETLARLEHAILVLQESQKHHTSSATTLQPALEELRAMRQKLLSRLSLVHARYKQTTGENAKQCLDEMHDTTEKIRQMDELLVSQSRVSAVSLPVAEMVSRLQTAIAQVRDDQDVLLVQVEALSSIVKQSFRTMETSLRMRQVSDSFPQSQIDSLRETRRSLSELIRLSSAGQESAFQMAKSSVNSLSRDPVDEQQVLSEVESLLRTTVSRQCR